MASTVIEKTADSTASDTAVDYDRFLIAVTEDLPTLDDCYQFVASEPSCGAVSTFVGITRDNFQGKIVQKLSYEGYVPMAIKELRKLCVEAISAEQYPSVRRIAMVHILGDCPVGKASVIIACSSPHRTDAIHCCEFLINELKARIPIWKLEVYQGDEGSVWKENVEWHGGRQKRVMVKQSSAASET
jgi:molybdopterin synthase catalytic subunit